MLLEAAHLRSPFCARALNYLEGHVISRPDMYEVAEFYPESKKKLRQYVCKLALRRMVVLMMREKAQLEELRIGARVIVTTAPLESARFRLLRSERLPYGKGSLLFFAYERTGGGDG